MKAISQGILLALACSFTPVLASDNVVRWTAAEDQNGSFAHILDVLNQKIGTHFTTQDFLLQENRDLAFNHYQRFSQLKNNIPVHAKSIRVWTDLNSDRTVQVEASVEAPEPDSQGRYRRYALENLRKPVSDLQDELSREQTLALVRNKVRSNSEDPIIQGSTWKDEWEDGELFRHVKTKGKRGYHSVKINLRTQRVSAYQYHQFPQDDFSVPVNVYPIYEEVEGTPGVLNRIPAELKYLQSQYPQMNVNAYDPLKKQHYYDYNFDPLFGETSDGRAQGYWSMNYLKEQASLIRQSLPQVLNNWSQGVLLQGRYATINIHPDAFQKFAPQTFKAIPSTAFFPNWVETTVDNKSVGEMIPSFAWAGKPLYSAEEALNRPAERLKDHNPTQYMDDGFDEIQVYYAINTMFETLHARGFQDPELSTRPFNAFLYNPDISYRDNAFYTDDTINFTTYSPDAPNEARDNSTIWHELGHGVMDRLMGDNIELADTGGLSEGMADFVAAMVIQGVTQGQSFPGSDMFRIINKTGFYLTNEVHDDGEAYGGTMKDFMDAVIAVNGQAGLAKVTDVVLEAMRLTRDYPGLTAPVWFSHILFADSLGRPGVREKNELAPYLLKALESRNFKMDHSSVAQYHLVNLDSNQEVVAGSLGSRDNPILVNIAHDGKANFQVSASLKSSDEYAFQYPVQIRVQYNGGPLQGAVHWVGEENGTQVYTLNSEADVAKIPLQVTGACDYVNRPDGSCSDFAYIQVWNHGDNHPIAKKRFYLKVHNPA